MWLHRRLRYPCVNLNLTLQSVSHGFFRSLLPVKQSHRFCRAEVNFYRPATRILAVSRDFPGVRSTDILQNDRITAMTKYVHTFVGRNKNKCKKRWDTGRHEKSESVPWQINPTFLAMRLVIFIVFSSFGRFFYIYILNVLYRLILNAF